MKQINSELLQNQEATPLGFQDGVLDLYDGLSTPSSTDSVVLSDKHRQQIEAFAALAATNYSPETTMVYGQFGIPTLVARIDCTIDTDGNIAPYEMEDSPSGQGITDALHRGAGQVGIRQVVLDHYEEMVGEPPTIVVASARNHGTDDILIVGSDKYFGPTDPVNPSEISGPCIVKAIPGDTSSHLPYLSLQAQALAPLETEGDKTYAEKIGILESAFSDEDLRLDENGDLQSQVVKARLGSMAMGVSIYLSKEDRLRFGKAGTVTASRLKRDLEAYCENNAGALRQDFIAPIQITNEQDRTNAVLRIFTLLNRRSGVVEAQAIGGCYVARNEVLLHGASNAVSGAVLV